MRGPSAVGPVGAPSRVYAFRTLFDGGPWAEVTLPAPFVTRLCPDYRSLAGREEDTPCCVLCISPRRLVGSRSTSDSVGGTHTSPCARARMHELSVHFQCVEFCTATSPPRAQRNCDCKVRASTISRASFFLLSGQIGWTRTRGRTNAYIRPRMTSEDERRQTKTGLAQRALRTAELDRIELAGFAGLGEGARQAGAPGVGASTGFDARHGLRDEDCDARCTWMRCADGVADRRPRARDEWRGVRPSESGPEGGVAGVRWDVLSRSARECDDGRDAAAEFHMSGSISASLGVMLRDREIMGQRRGAAGSVPVFVFGQ
ncbi:hypothetical protein HETIRDRAFT_447680 [Heterobasidion irregulare TC 32-1]|uniref:Uncharacterized protein n=1 Tax=Heterobasidion irregulare (strain TC 32-1) TaxID=747525 RepID=W4KMN0_HETIT|nr:uncharacterized protein HETIRDRAFT_447680 [Heterobasidion irregulare TC 32-1]ETW87077.1 hypothetical protein HETIRDRAFT_447680 [Heterobasidion irregulare TC 32-1]